MPSPSSPLFVALVPIWIQVERNHPEETGCLCLVSRLKGMRLGQPGSASLPAAVLQDLQNGDFAEVQGMAMPLQLCITQVGGTTSPLSLQA